ncbi:cyclic nucleotide-binding domain-containing protein [Deinococcus sp. KSM4-11]|uniref:FAD-dependent oxidoreductase n=1 Tax=Deinococcus sp. KSM4-11 TaxID=2568654 RepID=UPI0010A316BB|nr:FAD-dependent oxidoreductase [Deinococcus sp. KSM4-11]THF87087.1 cyclic nucleotide-binding domain-containing protein [Deinococcus sp. KSM4-11]
MITPELLRSLALFASLDDAALQAVALEAADVRLNAGEYLVQEGDSVAFFVLLEGQLDVSKEVGGVLQTLDTYGPGDSFGELPLLLGTSATVNLRAAGAVRVLQLDGPDFLALLAHSEALAATVMANMTRRVRNLQRVTLGAPVVPTLLVGSADDLRCFRLREFLSRNQVAFRWLDPESPVMACDLPPLEAGPLPAVILPGGEVLRQPDVQEVARRVGLQVEPHLPEYDVVIVGGGPAGLAAAVYGASEGLCTLLLDKEAPGGQAGTSSRIENYLGFPTGLSGAELSARALRQARRFGAEVVITREVTALEPGETGHTVVLDGGDRVQAQNVVLAMGVEWRKLPLPDAGRFVGRGLWYGAARTEAPGTRGKDVYLIGGGNSAGQAAMFFSNYAARVSILIRADRIEQGMSQYLVAQLRVRPNVRICEHCEVTALRGDAHLQGLTVHHRDTGEDEQVETDSLFVLIGADARTDWLGRTVLRDERGYVCSGLDLAPQNAWPLERDPFLLETSVPGVFVVGDVRRGSIKRVASGVGEGSMSIALIHQYLALEPGGRNA